ncbi:glutathione synthetase [Mycoplana rhizolycopersici]|uniref:Glutathione synthetase n=1 Tax=Mycoplana rhizolycopersici TaxID=2746702 RepID=A0ABX2QPT8_9HYPH|nr:glutathione synthetase [Rhizobium rhizolycopersici]NVP58336.1 glutathione synthase [Rhizobium rhizolycopersici]
MRIAFFVNSIEGETATYTTTGLAFSALCRGHEVCYVTPADFILRPDDSLWVRGRVLPAAKRYRKVQSLHADLQGTETKIDIVDAREIDVLFLRNDPSLDEGGRAWAAHVGAMFGRLAAARGVVVLNDPDGLSLAQNKLYFQGFPRAVRPDTLISKSIDEIRAFVDSNPEGVILKPLQGSGGKNVFKIGSTDEANLNQIFEAVSGEGYLIAQAYLPAATEGDIRLFLMNGRPLIRDGKYAAIRRVPTEGEVRSNIHASGTAVAVDVNTDVLAVAEVVRPKLVEDGMFLVGLDIVGDRILEINVFTPGGLSVMRELYDVDFSDSIVEALERKIVHRNGNLGVLSNRAIATL